jgi:hypothetical protein
VNKVATQPKRRLEKLNNYVENKGTTQINYGCIRKQTKKIVREAMERGEKN